MATAHLTGLTPSISICQLQFYGAIICTYSLSYFFTDQSYFFLWLMSCWAEHHLQRGDWVSLPKNSISKIFHPPLMKRFLHGTNKWSRSQEVKKVPEESRKNKDPYRSRRVQKSLVGFKSVPLFPILADCSTDQFKVEKNDGHCLVELAVVP